MCVSLVECCETVRSRLLKTVRHVEIAGVEVQTVRRMFQGFILQISVGPKCLVRPLQKDIVVLLLFIACPNVSHEYIQLSASEDIRRINPLAPEFSFKF